MHSKRELFEQDLLTLETMIAHLPEYLISDKTEWEIYKHATPKLTMGGCLMRQQRLCLLKDQLSLQQQERLQKADAALQDIMRNNVVRVEQKTHQELHARLRDWMDCLRNVRRHVDREGCYYADKVDNRVVITAMIAQMQQAPFKLEKQISNEVRTLDNNLQKRWQPGEFIWIKDWQAAYPSDTYWYLYGQPEA